MTMSGPTLPNVLGLSSKMSSAKCIKKAVKCLKSGQYGLSCGHFCLALRNASDRQSYEVLSNRWKSTFLYAFERHIHFLEASRADKDTLMAAFDEAINAIPDCEDIHYHKGIHFYKCGKLSDAVSSFSTSLTLNPDYNLAHLCLENIRSSSIARWHYIMINDIKRNSAFRDSIAIAVRRGHDSVLDIGSGSGLLSLYCVQSGAREVYACEVSQMLYHLCGDVLKTNGVDKQVVLFNEMSTNIQIPQMIPHKVNLIVTEIFDSALFGEHVLTTLRSALKELLDPRHGLVLPMKARVSGVLIESQELRNSFSVGRNFGSTLLSDKLPVCVNFEDFKYTTINLSKVNKKYLSDKFEIIEIDFNDISQIESILRNDYVLNVVVKCLSVGRLDAIGVWFDLHLIDDIHISSEPPSQLVGWEQAIYPAALRPVQVDHNSELVLSFTLKEDFLKLIDVKLTNSDQSLVKCDAIHLSHEMIKYLNANNYHEKYIQAIDQMIKSANFENIVDFTYLPVVSVHFIDHQFPGQVFIMNEELKSEQYFDKIVNIFKSTDKLINLEFDELVAKNVISDRTLVVWDVFEPTGLIRSNILDKLAYLCVYSSNRPTFIPNKIVFKALLIQSDELLIRSRLVSDDNVHGFRIKDLLNVFETEILQDIDHQKLEFVKLSDTFDLMELDLQRMFNSTDEINLEPRGNCTADIIRCGNLAAVLYWYEIHLSHEIVISSLDLGPDWHSTAFVLKQTIALTDNHKVSIDCFYTNGFLRIKDLKVI